MNAYLKEKTRLPLLIAAAAAALIVTAACGSGAGAPGGEAISRVEPVEQVLSLEDLEGMGFKESKTYDVEGLQGVTGAYFGFWGLDPYDRKDFEVRLYPSHTAAVEQGTAQAEERAGPEPKLTEEEVTWAEGLKDARQCGGDKGSGPASHGIQNCRSPKYRDYYIYGNMILLCSGGDKETAGRNCLEFLAQLHPAASPG